MKKKERLPSGYCDFSTEPLPSSIPNLTYDYNSRKERVGKAVNKIGPTVVYVGQKAAEYRDRFGSKVDEGRKKFDDARKEVSGAFDQIHVDLNNSLDFKADLGDFGNNFTKNKKAKNDEDLITW